MKQFPQGMPGPGKQRGLTLLEVLIAVVVLAIGLLGVAGLQLAALQNGQQSYLRSQASTLAYEIADRMRANRGQAILGAYMLNASTSTTPVAPAAPAVDCNSTNCTPAQFVQSDLSTWYTNVTNTLPAGAARIICGTPTAAVACTAGSLQTVQIIWDEQRTGATNANCAAVDANHLSCYSVSFAP
jgi:type IV pilus assembly protein PilV